VKEGQKKFVMGRKGFSFMSSPLHERRKIVGDSGNGKMQVYPETLVKKTHKEETEN